MVAWHRLRRDRGEGVVSRGGTARSVALDVIVATRESDAYANLLLPARILSAGLSSADAGLATELAYGTLRMQGFYDRVIELAAARPVKDIDAAALDVLRLGCHQLLSMRVAAHAAVGETVELAKGRVSRSAVGFVNGVLRTVSRTDVLEWRDRVIATARSGEEALAFEHSHPLWVVRAIRQVLTAEGREAELEGALVADNVAPRIAAAALPGFASPIEIPGSRTEFSPVGVRVDAGDPARVPAIKDGRARVQDEGSQLAALALSRARPVGEGERWLDMCAGPGGKAALLAAEAASGGATLTANEVVPARAGLVRNALRAVDPTITVLEQDGRMLGEEHPDTFDRILLDAPCTGLGALRRRPEARWRKQPSDVAELGALQSALLSSAVAALRPGGLLAYVTCSPHAAETKAIVASALRTIPGLSTVNTPAVLESIASHPLDLPPGEHVQLWPHRHGTDAMFIQLLTKA
ncbi:16S rRNA (cytosine967-C5)-methyltransferase [Microbacteriaceae bacterium SG_E_30_P1]|uniref:16S rRNA (Cytosine967-C5)-methyltransferase n=1 Tax=Antiquaquibacter oligotrophicus TaxID=2880260 RepID=A0ABT6KLR3_9MICO|nr:transcription antitermination factor NusB [Antiquaquibacter oligotrophicus]MDH6180966.1 16S rRNA (cytosine967-C5)-methyltransferase [Antiquaquibacter oligotrophicus]UDF13333.1 rRNA small subunit methyltransferase B [Antiquaquibacter oligotrophicus]